ncbi:MAG: glycosyltransferase family 4 protein, partial [Thermoplasmata archaeon]
RGAGGGARRGTRPPAPPTIRRAVGARRLHILMIGWEFPPHHSGGLGVHSFEICREITEMGHRVTFLTPFSGPFTPVHGVTFLWPGAPRPGTVGSEDATAAEMPILSPYDHPLDPGLPHLEAMTDYNGWIESLTGLDSVDVIHVHDWFGTVGAAALARRLHRPLVMTMHSTEYDRSLGHPWTEIVGREQVGLDAAEAVIAVSQHLKEQLIRRYHVPAEKIRVIYNAVRPPEWIGRLATRAPVVLYLGRLAAMKGVDTFLRAGARVLRQLSDVVLVVAGEGPEYPRLLMLAAHLGIGDQVLFLGKISEEERSALLARTSVFVLPSVVEPFGIAALEAMAAGVPTIVSKTSGIVEVAEAVFAVDFWDIDEFASRIAELLQYPILRTTMGDRGRDEALREGWPERALDTVGVYARLIRRHDGAAP